MNEAATLKARREGIGLSVHEFARALNISERTVNRWDNEITSVARFAEGEMARLEQMFFESSDAIVENVLSVFSEPCPVVIEYYKRPHHCAGIRSGILGLENAAARDAAARLEAMGYEVSFAYSKAFYDEKPTDE